MIRSAVLIFSLASCAAQPSAKWIGARDVQWPRLQRALDEVRAARPRQPWAVGVRATLREPTTGHVLQARGAIAVAPGRAARVVLVGGPGATVLDAWVTLDRWRVAVPPAGVLRRGGADAPPDLPVGFLRWWFLRALAGTLFAASVDRGGAVWLLRDGDAVLELRPSSSDGRSHLEVVRRVQGHTERVDEARAGPVLRPGDRVRYEADRGLEVDLEVESIPSAPPEAAAFDDPDVPAPAHE